ncbi:light-dependent protochlorophyllide reductase [compost metagenome]
MLVEAGAKVVVADLDQVGGVAAVERIRQNRKDADITFSPLDLGSLQSIEGFCTDLLAQGSPLDLLFNNAGIQPLNARRATRDGFELTFGIGHLGHFALTGRLLPLLLESPTPRVITTSSLVHPRGWFDRDDLQIERNYDAQRAYNQTKLANLLFARELQRRASLAGVSLTSVAAHPGVARTSIGANRRRQGKLGWRDHVVSLTLSIVMPLLGQDATRGALPLLHAATAAVGNDGGFYGPSGFAEMKGAPGPARGAQVARDEELASWLWETSVRLTQVDFQSLSQIASSRNQQALA